MRIRTMLKDPKVASIPLFLGTVALEAWYVNRQPTRGPIPKGDSAPASDQQLELDELVPDHEPLKPLVGYRWEDAAASVAMGAGSLALNVAYDRVWHRLERRLYDRRIIDVGSGPLGWAVAIVGWDFLYYWEHRASHRVRLFWANHVNHHSSEYYNLTTALRQPWSDYLTRWFFSPLALLGVTPAVHTGAAGLNLLYQYWIHTEAIDRCPDPIEGAFNTASHHRVHHGSNTQYLDKNYGSIFIIWDRLFGTFEPERERPRYGLTKNITTFNPVRIATHELAAVGRDVRRAATWRDRFRAVFSPPGTKIRFKAAPAVRATPAPTVDTEQPQLVPVN